MRIISSHLKFAALVGGLFCGDGGAFAADAEKGKASFMKYGCFQCHGMVGQGAVTGPKLAPDPLPWEALSTFVRTTNRTMPPYKEAVLPTADLQDIYAYLQSIPPTRDWKTIPLLGQ
jgi:mono/diheme cytochrome c family protein